MVYTITNKLSTYLIIGKVVLQHGESTSIDAVTNEYLRLERLGAISIAEPQELPATAPKPVKVAAPPEKKITENKE